ncbi:hypothetical protein ACRAWF_38470 [Streptomyces sp. L7]
MTHPSGEKVFPGDAFVDAGADWRSASPLVRGNPDHGDAWSRPWTREGGGGRRPLRPLHAGMRTVRDTTGGAEADCRAHGRRGLPLRMGRPCPA